MKRILSVLLVLVMIIGMLPMTLLTASAAETSVEMAVVGTGGTLSADSNSISWTSGVVTFTNVKGSTAIRNSDSAHYRIYAGSSLNIACSAGNITKIVITATSSSYANVLVTSAGSEAVASGSTVTITPTTPAATYNIATMSAQSRISKVAVTYSDVSSTECTHANTETIAAVAATCTTAGNTEGTKCADCGKILSGNETIAALGHTNDAGVVTAPTCTEDGYTLYTCTVCGSSAKSDWVDATGHNYVDGTCSVCGTAKPAGLDGKYYIAAIRKTGNYFYMTTNKEEGKDRFVAVDSGLTKLPTEITTVDDTYVIELVSADNGYKVKIGDQYLGWNSGNTAILVAENAATVAVVEYAATEGAYNIHFAATDAERYLALNNTTGNNYFLWYKDGQADDLYLVPVSETAAACTHTNTTVEGKVDATCTAAGSTGTVICSDCGATVTEATEIPALEHTYVDGICTGCGKEFETEPDTPDEEGSYVKATSVSVGDTIIIVSEKALMELSSFSTTSTVYGIGTAYTDIPAGTMTWTVEEGTVAGSYAFKNADGNYLYWSSGNSLKTSATKDAQSSWTVAFSGNDVTMVNAGTVDVARHIAWNSGSPRFANYKDSSISGYSTYYAIQFYKYEAAGACTHSWGEWVTTTAPTCTTAGVQTATCTLCNDATTTQPVAVTGHTYTCTDTAITCANCDYSAAYTLSTIAEAKAYTDDSAVYYVKGVVTYVSGNKIYIEDNTGALLVMFNGEDGAGITLGDEILVWDCLTTYNGLIETTYTTATEYLKVSSGNALPSQTVTIADLLADTTNEYLAERVVIEGVTVGTINTSGNTALTDANGNSINIYKVSGLAENINENDTVTVTAIVSTYNGYQLLINPGTAATDVVETAAGEEEVVTTVTIAEAKAGTAGEYYQVEGTVTYISGRNVYIQDATGGIVVYLTANAATTKVGDNVKAYGALKNYNGLIELDAVDETNAEFYNILSNGNTVDAQTVTIADLIADNTNEYLAEKITLSDVYVSHYSYNSSYKNVNYYLVDGNGNEICVYRVTVASEEECVVGGSIVTVEAVVSAYNGYQLVTINDKITVTGTCAHETTELVNAKDATCTEVGYTGDTMCVVCGFYTARGEATELIGHDNADGFCSMCESKIVASIGSTYYVDFATAYAEGTGKEIVLLADAGTMDAPITLTKDLYVDLNGCGLFVSGIEGTNYTVLAKDSATDAYEEDAWGSITITNATLKAMTGYVALVESDNEYSLHAYKLELTHVSLDPANDALGYKAALKGDYRVLEAVVSYGFNMGVAGGLSKEVSCTLAEGETFDGEFTLRLKNIMAVNGGRYVINGAAFVVFADGTNTKTDTHNTTMRDTILTVNDMTLTDSQKAAVYNLYKDYSDEMNAWFMEANKTNNIATWAPTSTEEVPAE